MTEGLPAPHVREIIAEFSQVFAFMRARWAQYAEEVHPELRGLGMLVLQTILRKGPVTATELSALLTMDKAVVSRQVTKLRDLGLVAAVPAEEDRRVTLLTASPAAESAISGLRDLTAAAYQQRFAGWSDTDLAELSRLLHRFNSAGDAEQAPHGGPAVRCSRHASA